ncbi:hypothetical protein [uncultured Campylobacter sp.]|uniref:hypothetical protein n=1 Tax=uncultured Campylobacter sp. TaxID=218934 RepID=UPI00261759EC|nr:hypothetical protein [uncultured Campylobacter sp.]
MSFTVLVLYVEDFFPKLQEKHSWTALSILALVYLYKALKKLQPMCETNLMRPFHAYLVLGIVTAAALLAGILYNPIFTLLFLVLLVVTMIFWMILNFRLSRITQNPLFKFHSVMLIVSVASSLTVLFLKANPGSALYYADAEITATAHALLVGAWCGVEDVEDI